MNNNDLNQEEVKDNSATSENSEINQEMSIDNLKEKINDLEKKVEEFKDLYLRSKAEIYNIQKRNIEEVKKSRDYSISSFAKEIIVVKDYLEMALKDQSGNVEAIKTGVDLTLKQLIQIFENNKIKEINPSAKDKLDPNLHQAVNTVEVDSQESNTIIEIMQKGYSLNERVLRPAMVTVAK